MNRDYWWLALVVVLFLVFCFLTFFIVSANSSHGDRGVTYRVRVDHPITTRSESHLTIDAPYCGSAVIDTGDNIDVRAVKANRCVVGISADYPGPVVIRVVLFSRTGEYLGKALWRGAARS